MNIDGKVSSQGEVNARVEDYINGNKVPDAWKEEARNQMKQAATHVNRLKSAGYSDEQIQQSLIQSENMQSFNSAWGNIDDKMLAVESPQYT